MPTPDIYQRTMIDVLTPEIKRLVKDYYTMHQFVMTGCTREDGFSGQGVVPVHEMEKHYVFKTTTQLGTYNHHQNIVKWKGEYWCSWDNCMVNEEWPGQRTFISHSKNGETWSERILVADGDEEKGMLRNCGCLYAGQDRLYAIIQEKWDMVHATAPSMSAHEKMSYRNDLWASSDGVRWECIERGFIDAKWVLENLRLTNEGRLMGPITTHGLAPGVALWPGDDPAVKPQIIEFPYEGHPGNYFAGHDEGLFLYGEASWYTDADNRIWMWHRDESGSTVLGVAISEDGGRTWSEVMRSNFPDSMSRVFAGTLTDGRYFLVGNQTCVFMDRNFFAISLSDDGAKYGKMYQLIKPPVRQRFQGHLKCHGYQYPSCLADGDKLLIVYSVNKEDIECGIVDTRQI